MNRELWPHQASALLALRQTIGQGVKRIVLQSPCGSGKTLLAAAIIEGALAKGNRVNFVVSNLSLIDQTLSAFYREGIRDVGVIQASHPMEDWSKPVQIVSIATINRRKVFPDGTVNIFDECHVLYDAHKEWLKQQVVFIGLSATPYTKGLGKYFETMITVATTEEMIAKKILCPFRVFSCGHPSLKQRLKKVKVIAGDYQENQLSGVMQSHELSGDVVRTWQERWGKGKTLVFAVDCAHAQMLQAKFIDAGVRCGYQDAKTPNDERADIKRKFHNGDYDVVVNVLTLSIGTDWDVRCLSMCRPTKSKMLYKQIYGRALRIADGKDCAVFLDHARVTQELGFVTDIEADELDMGHEVPPAKPRKVYAKECPSCHMFKPPGAKKCLNCGFEPTPTSDWAESDDELEEVDRATLPRKRKSRDFTMEEKGDFYAQLKSYARTHGYKQGWAANKFRDKFSCWPDHSIKHVPSQAPTQAVLAWIRHTQIKWMKSQRSRPVEPSPRPQPIDPASYAHIPITHLPSGIAAARDEK